MIVFNKVTWYSRLAAIIFFVGILPLLAFYIGVKYQEVQMMEALGVVEIVSAPTINNIQTPTNQTIDSSLYNTLTSYEWIWEETHKGTGPESLLGGKITPRTPGAFTIVFDDNGNISGTTDCNSFGGTYTLEAGTIDFGPLVSTMMFCEGSQEQEFVSMIKKGGLSIGENSLSLEHEQTVLFEKGARRK